VPFFYVPNTTITEQFNPLIGIDATTLSGLSLRFNYLKGRTVSLSLVDYQVSEVHNSGFTLGTTFHKKGIVLPFSIPFTDGIRRLDNDMTFKLDLSIQNNSTSNSILDQNLTTPVAGNKTVKIDPSVDYVVNKKINVRLYFDQTRVIPYISSSPPTVLTRMGIEFKVSLAP
jgi:cell surface protein SprA